MPRIIFFILAAHALLASCAQKKQMLFEKLGREQHGIDFRNSILESDSLNILTLEYIYNGGGVGVADFNRDGLSDIFLTGNMVSGRLYLNLGELRFRDVSAEAGVLTTGKWLSGMAIGDVNGDDLPDIYICATIHPDPDLRKNILFINRGVNADGVPVFANEAEAYGVDYDGHSSGAAFLDFDNDDDLDLYILTNTIEKGIPTSYRPKVDDGTSLNADRLLRNNGDGTFTDISIAAGIVHEGYGLGVAIADINKDGWQDILVSNDYITNDLLYINNKDGTFTNEINSCLRHQSQFSMGNDVADFNNDGLPDIVTLDMLPEGNLRRKTVITGPGYSTYINNAKYGYSPQYVRNMLHINNGDGTFSEIGQLAGVHQTEWSWSPLFADFDNDGFRDLVVTNGFPRDITDKDFANFRSGPAGNVASNEYLLDSVPVVKVSNYIFRNQGDLTFKDVTQEWGMFEPTFANGAAFADFDNDGDLDYIANNINDEVSFYRNTLMERQTDSGNYLRLRLRGKGKNSAGLGTKVMLRYQGQKIQYHDHSVARGYISSVEDVVHFGLDTMGVVDTVIIQWPDKKVTLITNVQANQTLTVDHGDAVDLNLQEITVKPLLEPFNRPAAVSFVHEEEDRIDFNIQRTLPHKLSQSGPGVAVGDVNGDGLDDFFVGGAANRDGHLFVQNKNSTFTGKALKGVDARASEDQGALFFDADADGDLDLYVVAGSYEYEPDSPHHQDRLYKNDGMGNFALDRSALPATTSSGSCVRAADFDRDGDLDLFVGGRIVPGQYPKGGESYILVNEGKFVNRTAELASELQYAGMITDALWTDYDNDTFVDLIVSGEFMPITVFRQDNGKFRKMTNTGLEQYRGWWNSISGGDFDNDGDVDYLAGNLGNNNYFKASPATPLRAYARDFDNNSSLDLVLSCYLRSETGKLEEFPVHFWDELNSQSPMFRRKFAFYKQYGRANMDKLLPPSERVGAIVLETNHTASSYIENTGKGTFRMHSLPVEAQFAPVNGIVVADVNGDLLLDALLVGNDYGNEIFVGRHDAFNGLVLLGDGAGAFRPLSSRAGGFRVQGDGKALARLVMNGRDVLIATQNRDSLKMFSTQGPQRATVYSPAFDDHVAEITYVNGRTQRTELYYGAGYLSQSTRKIILPPGASLKIYDFAGRVRDRSSGLASATAAGR